MLLFNTNFIPESFQQYRLKSLFQVLADHFKTQHISLKALFELLNVKQ